MGFLAGRELRRWMVREKGAMDGGSSDDLFPFLKRLCFY